MLLREVCWCGALRLKLSVFSRDLDVHAESTEGQLPGRGIIAQRCERRQGALAATPGTFFYVVELCFTSE